MASRSPFAASNFYASWMPTPAPREGIGAAVPPHTALRLYGVNKIWSLRDHRHNGTPLSLTASVCFIRRKPVSPLRAVFRQGQKLGRECDRWLVVVYGLRFSVCDYLVPKP